MTSALGRIYTCPICPEEGAETWGGSVAHMFLHLEDSVPADTREEHWQHREEAMEVAAILTTIRLVDETKLYQDKLA